VETFAAPARSIVAESGPADQLRPSSEIPPARTTARLQSVTQSRHTPGAKAHHFEFHH
jgi:hypothetical protein